MASPLLTQLKGLAKAAPTFNDQARKQQLAAQQMDVQKAISAAPVGGRIGVQAQAIAPAVQTAANQVNLEAAKADVGQQAELGSALVQQQGVEAQQGVQQQALAQQASLAQQEIQAGLAKQRAQEAARKEMSEAEINQAKALQARGIEMEAQASFLDRTQRESLAALGGDVKAQLFDSRMAFEKDEAGRKFTNERQLADWAVASAKDTNQLNSRLREMDQANQKELIMLESAYKKLSQGLNQAFRDSELGKDQDLKRQLAAQKVALEKDLAKKRQKGNMLSMAISGAGSGAMIGGQVGGPWGAAGGAVLGAGAGIAAANQA